METTKDKKKNGAAGPTTPRDTPPATMNEVHRITWRLHGERLEKLQAQMLLLQTQAKAISADQEETQAKLNDHKQKMRMVYDLADADRVDFETGAITRAPRTPPVAN